MKKLTRLFLAGLLTITLLSVLSAGEETVAKVGEGEYSMVVESYDSGPGLSRVILSLDESAASVFLGDDYGVVGGAVEIGFEGWAERAAIQQSEMGSYQ